MAKNTINVSVFADAAPFRKEMKQLGDVSGLSKLRSGISAVASKLWEMTKAASLALGALGVASVKAASDLEQSQGTVDDVFKTSAQQVKDYASASSKNLGLAKNEYYELANIIGTQLKNGGTAVDQLAGKSNDLISLGADLSAGFGGSTVDAVEAISSALKGERDPIEKYGVSLKQTTIDAQAAAMGFTKVGGSFTNEAQQAATLALIMDQTSDMHGKFSRESDTLAHKTQVLKAQLTDGAAKIGAFLIPAVSSAVGWISDRLDPAIEWVTTFIDSKAKPAITTLASAFKTDWIPRIKEIASQTQERLGPILKDLTTFITGSLIPGIASLVTWMKDHKDALVVIAAALGGAVAAWRTYQTVMATARAVTEAFKLAQLALNGAVAANPVGILITVFGALISILVTLWTTNEAFRTKVTEIWTTITTFIGGKVNSIIGFVGGLGQIPGNVAAWFSDMKARAAAKLDEMVSYVSTIPSRSLNALSALAGNMRSSATNSFQSFKDGVIERASSTVSWIGGLPSRITGALGDMGSLLYGAGKKIISGLWDGMKGAFNGVKSWVSGVGTWIADHKGPEKYDRELLIPAGKWIMEGLGEGLDSQFSRVKKQVSSMGGELKSSFGRPELSASLSDTLSIPYTAQVAPITVNVTAQMLTPSAEAGRIIGKSVDAYLTKVGR